MGIRTLVTAMTAPLLWVSGLDLDGVEDGLRLYETGSLDAAALRSVAENFLRRQRHGTAHRGV
jgi:hypothetical protein